MRFLQGADKSARLAYRAVYIPKDARLVPGPAGCAVYAYGMAGKYYALAFRGTAGKPEWHYCYRTEEQRTQAIESFWKGVISSQEFKAKRQADKSAWVNPLTVGTVLVSSWGYDQTNIDFYVVTKVSGKRVWIRPIAQDGESTGWCQERVWPAMPIRMTGDETMHVAQPSGDKGAYIKVGHQYAHVEEGRSHHSSSYA